MNSEIQSFYEQGLLELEKSNWKASRVCWEKIVGLDPMDLIAAQNMAFCALKMEDYLLCIQLVTQILEENERELELYRLRAEAHYKIENFELALKDAKIVLESNPDDTWMWQVVISSYSLSGHDELVEGCLITALKTNPTHAFLGYMYANILLGHSRYSEAISTLQILKLSNPSASYITSKLAETLIVVGETTEGKLLLEDAYKNEKLDASGCNHLGFLYLSEFRKKDAQTLFELSVDILSEQVDAYLGLVHCALQNGYIQQAKTLCDDVVLRNPNDQRAIDLNGYLQSIH